MTANVFHDTIEFWIQELDHYEYSQLCTKPSPTAWSLGQVAMHLIENTQYFFDEIKICINTNDNFDKHASAAATIMFSNNDFPDERIEGPPSNQNTPQPESKEQLLRDLTDLKNEIRHMETLISTSHFKGKTKHPGLHYFSASEWFQFAEMHFRHHLRQKKRIEDFLKTHKANY